MGEIYAYEELSLEVFIIRSPTYLLWLSRKKKPNLTTGNQRTIIVVVVVAAVAGTIHRSSHNTTLMFFMMHKHHYCDAINLSTSFLAWTAPLQVSFDKCIRSPRKVILFCRSVHYTAGLVVSSSARLVALSLVCALHRLQLGVEAQPRPVEETPPSRIDWWGSSSWWRRERWDDTGFVPYSTPKNY